MTINASIFRAYDIRGIVPQDLNRDVVYQIGLAFGSEAIDQQQTTAVVGRDGRLSSPELSIALCAGLQASGINVIDIGIVPTPVLYFATHHLKTGTGIMITGSHNPPDYNGLKMMMAGQTLHGDTIKQLHKRIEEKRLHEGAGTLETIDLNQTYIDRVASSITLERPLKVAIDCGNGAAAAIASDFFKALGLKDFVELFCTVDGTFPNHHPDPSKEKNLEDLRKAVKEQNLDIGLAFDGDGDRLGIIDGDGNIIWPDRAMILYAQDILSRNPDATIIFDVKCSKHLREAITTAGGQPIMSQTGHSLIKARMQETGALLAGEMSGHIFFKERWYGFDDGLYTAARLLEILSRQSESPKSLFAKLPNSVNTPELNISFDEGAHYAFIEKLQKNAQFTDADITTIDGIRADYKDGWGLVRASNTTPSVVLRFEADSETALQRIQDEFRQQMLNADANVKLPF